MKWFKHISDSLDDPFIFSLMEEFGGDGYLVFFGVIEIYAREFQTKNDWKLTEKLSFFRHKLLISQSKFKKILSKITKWEVQYIDDKVSIFIPKFKELMDESTIKKLRENEKSFRNHSGIVPKSEATEAEEDADKDIYMSTNGHCPHSDIISLYHKTLPMLPQLRVLTDARKKHLSTRWKEDKERQNLEWWEGFFSYIAKSRFLTGKVTDRNGKAFLADLGWIIKPENFAKIIEGKYE